MEERRDYGTNDHPVTKTELQAEQGTSPYPHHWTETFAGRELEEIKFARTYHQRYGHGTPGHLHLLLISQLSRQVDILMGRDPDWDRANW